MVNVQRKWILREYKEGDEEGIFDLCNAVYPEAQYDKESWMKWWHWQYKEIPFGSAKIWLADHDGKIVGQYPLIPLQFKARDKLLTAYLSLDVMTHPEYRYQGMFSLLERHALKEAEKEGIHITIGFPNDASYPGHVKSGYFLVSFMIEMQKLLNLKKTWFMLANLLAGKIKSRLLSRVGAATVLASNLLFAKVLGIGHKTSDQRLTVSEVPSFDKRFDDFWQVVAPEYDLTIVRNSDYLKWRYSTPGTDYFIYAAEKAGEICGYAILQFVERRGLKVGRIMDMVVGKDSPQSAPTLVSKAVERCRQEGMDLVTYSALKSRAYYSVFRKNGFITIPYLRGGRLCVYSVSPDITKGFLQDPRHWLIRTGDTDSI